MIAVVSLVLLIVIVLIEVVSKGKQLAEVLLFVALAFCDELMMIFFKRSNWELLWFACRRRA